MVHPGCRPAPPQAPLPLEVSFAGCTQVEPGPVCALAERDVLRVWARSSPDASLDVAGPVEIRDRSEIQAGIRFTLRPTADDGELRLTASGEGSAPAQWRLSWKRLPARPELLVRADEHLLAGRLDAARAVLEEELPNFSGGDLGLAYRWLGRIAQLNGDIDRAVKLHGRAVEIFHQQGLLRQEASCTNELAYGLIYPANRLAEARALLDGLSLGAQYPAEARYNRTYMQGLLAINTGNLRGALNQLRASAEIAQRVGLTSWQITSEQLLAHQLQQVGRGAEAAAIYTRQLAETAGELSACDRGQLLNNLGWNQLLMGEGDPDAVSPEATRWLEEAQGLFEDQPCAEIDERANVAINLALAAVQQGQAEVARRHLARAIELAPEPALQKRIWRLEIAGRIALAGGQPEVALERYRELETRAQAALSSPDLWQAAAGKAAALEELGRLDAALEAYGVADARLERGSRQVPIDAGREGFVDRGARVTQRHLALLLRQGQVDEAYALARRARSRVVRNLQWQSRLAQLTPAEQSQWDVAITAYRRQRQAFDTATLDDWRLPADQLRRQQHARQRERELLQQALDEAFATLDALTPAVEPALSPAADGEARLLYFPLPDGWVGFAEDARGLRMERLGKLSPSMTANALAERLLEPFADVIERVETVRFLPYGWLREVDLHALPFGADILVALRPVTYGLDLAHSEMPGSPTRHVLVVADPSGDLVAARTEGATVVEEIERLAPDWNPRLLTGEEADSTTLRALMPAADLLHYAGHGLFDGSTGLQSALPLAGDSRLTVADILALERVPRWVVLSGCETARTPQETSVESASGLAHAFLTSGSSGVLAAVRPVEDQLASSLVQHFYGAWLSGASPSQALRQAQLAIRQLQPQADWASFRFLEP
ncbi:MAG: CHAT domain-containing protein [Acidobacteriota bacterium]